MDPEFPESRDPWWMLALALVLLVLILWMLLDRTNTPEPGGVREGRLLAGQSPRSARASS